MILCCGEALIDMIPLTVQANPEIPEQRLVFCPYPGGSPYNTAIAIGRLGIPVQFLGRISKDFFGDLLIKRLSENKVGTDIVLRSGENSTLAFVKLEQGKEPQYIFYTEGTADRSFALTDLPAKLPDAVRCILFGSIAMTMEPAASAIESLIFREAKRSGSGPVISVDPNIRPFMIHDKHAYIKRFETWIQAATIVKISAADVAFIYPDLDLEHALQKIVDFGPCVVVTTLGPDGALLLRRDAGTMLRVQAPVLDLPVADTIGAGDTFHGAFLSWLELKGKMSRSALASLTETEAYDALFFANKAASIVCSRHGADPPTLTEVEGMRS